MKNYFKCFEIGFEAQFFACLMKQTNTSKKLGARGFNTLGSLIGHITIMNIT